MRNWIRMARERAGLLSEQPISPMTLSETAEHRAMIDAKALRTGRFLAAMNENRRGRDLCMSPGDWNPVHMPERAVVEIKHDGIRALRRHESVMTRGGMTFHATSHLWPVLQHLDHALGVPHMLDGEYVNPAGFEATLADMSRGRGTGMLVLFDAVPIDAYLGRTMSEPLYVRRVRLQKAILAAGGLVDSGVGLIRSNIFEGETRDDIEVAAGDAWAAGLEGLVVKDADSPYIRGRSNDWMRIKRQVTSDLRILGTCVEDGKVVSVLVSPSAGVFQSIVVGFTAADRADPEQFAEGRMIEISHLGHTQKGALRSAAFRHFRDDKA